MKAMGKLGTGFAAAVLCLVGATAGWAQGPGGMDMGPHRPPMEREMGPRGEMGRWWNSPKAIEKFKLTETQRKAMDDIYQQHRLTLVDLHASLEKAELTLEPLIGAEQPDEAKILAQIDKVAQARAELEKANARMLLGLRRQLTPDQWKELRAAWTARRDGHGEDGRGGPGGEHRWRGQGGPGRSGPGGPPSGGPGQPGAGTPPPPPQGAGEEE
ncbi:MAG TPA: periplasmic heavy metal sensor [Acidobacteriaceae bacterium]|nr:periplasmic heavy metal sensor [Acidobacteriaceae bacterium]